MADISLKGPGWANCLRTKGYSCVIAGIPHFGDLDGTSWVDYSREKIFVAIFLEKILLLNIGKNSVLYVKEVFLFVMDPIIMVTPISLLSATRYPST